MGNCYSCISKTFTTQPATGKGTGLPLLPFISAKPEPPAELPRPKSVEEDAVILPSSPLFFVSHVQPPADSNEITVLVVKSVEVCAEENSILHHTKEYDLVQSTTPTLVVRRGFPIKLRLTLSRNFDKEKDVICLVFTVKDAKNPSYSQGSMVFAPIVSSDENVLPSDGWQTKLIFTGDNSLTLEVTPVSTAIVGEWILDVDTKLKNEREEAAKSLRYTMPSPIYLLFNPWCNQDSVYMEDQEGRKEYVLNDSGLIWRGTSTRLRPCVWNYGQFEENILECCLYLLSRISKLSVVARADPVKVVRHISAVVNSPDDAGVLVGNWSGDYDGGQSPTHWSGSVAILQQYYKAKKPVKYGQCWVFSGISTTVCRALGIPARSVTNFASAHDTHNSLTIDYFYDSEGESVKNLNVDSVWNFHVWNEGWMDRPDLGPGYEGWQAIDATPQEESDGLYRCGPCSVAAIKRGEILKGYDAPFLFAEVNADKVYWLYQGKNLPLKLIQKKTDVIGQHISTKAIGSYDRMDITKEYKYEENSEEEREIMLRALRQCQNSFSRYYLNDNFEDIQFDFDLLDDIVIGSPFTVKLTAKNKGYEKRSYTIKGVFRVITTLYTGQQKKLVKKDKFEKTIAEGAEETIVLNVTFSDYERALVDQAAFNIAVMVQVDETGFDYFAQDDFRVRKPDIKILVDGETTQGKEFKVTAQLKNPLPKALGKGYFVIEGPGLGQPLKLAVKSKVAPNDEVEVSCKLCPKTHGEKSIVAKFWSKELDDVDGYKIIQVKPAHESETNNKPLENELTN